MKPPKQYNGGIPNLVCWGNSDLAAADKHKTILYPRLYFAPYRTDECLIISRLKKPSVGENGSHCHTKKHIINGMEAFDIKQQCSKAQGWACI